jgi:hypothetical protein
VHSLVALTLDDDDDDDDNDDVAFTESVPKEDIFCASFFLNHESAEKKSLAQEPEPFSQFCLFLILEEKRQTCQHQQQNGLSMES